MSKWLNFPLQKPWYATALQDVLGGYQASRVPAQMRQEEERQKLLAEELMGKNYEQQFKNQHLPEVHEQSMRKGEADIQRIMADTGLSRSQAEAVLFKLSMDQKYGGKERELGILGDELDIDKKRREIAAAKEEQEFFNKIISGQGDDGEQTELQKMLRDAWIAKKVGITPKQLSELNNKQKPVPVYDEEGKEIPIPANAVNTINYPAESQNFYRKQMNERFEKGQAAVQVIDAANNIKDLVKKYPELSKSFSYIFTNPEDQSSVNKFISSISNEKHQEALYEFLKNSNKMALFAAQNKGTRLTDFYLKSVMSTKTSAGMPAATANKLAEETIQENKYHVEDMKKITPFIGSPYYIPPVARKSIRPEGRKGIIEGEEKIIRPEDEKEFLSLGGKFL